MDANARIAEFAQFVPQIAPEAAGVVVMAQPAEWLMPRDTRAYAISGRHLGLREHLRSRGRWPGYYPGAIVFIDVPEDREELYGLGIHELAHQTPAWRWADIEPTEADRALQALALLVWSGTNPDPLLQPAPWLGHGADFIRRTLHLIARAAAKGVEVSLPAVGVAGAQYGLSGLWKYRRALGGEPARLAGCSFAEIENIPAPPEFIAVFEADCEAWNRRKVNDGNN
ncbi:MAG: hypothetical protein U0805_13505 [Pirellulales bacterium]